ENDTSNTNSSKIGNLSTKPNATNKTSSISNSNSQIKESSSQHKIADKLNIPDSDNKSFASDLDLHSAADGWDDDWQNDLTPQLGDLNLEEDKPTESKFEVKESTTSNAWEDDLVDDWNSSSDWQTDKVVVKPE